MAKHCFAVYRIQVSRMRRPDQVMPVDDLDGGGLDLLDLVGEALKELEHTPRRDERRQYYLSVPDHRRTEEREVEIRLDYGKFGSPGMVKDVHKHQDRYRIKQDEAATTFLRNLVVVPRRASFALLLTERYRRTGAGTAFLEHLKESTMPALRRRGLVLRHEALADSEAFRMFLARARLTEIEVRENFRGTDLFNQDETRPSGTFCHTYKPKRMDQALLSLFREQVLTRSFDMAELFHLRTAEHIVETRVTLNDDTQERTIILDEEETAPPLTYLLAEDDAPRPSDRQALAIMRETAARTCQHLAIDSD
ncbi:hypothetical protein [Nocardiopsis sp. FR4]|uniref:hypothetical protein n=1 Tax=Nocardiopsis sp. FR4 TaxID=2605985 RepID=UPI00135CCDEF|nr:hypothetical protein [Nocardiopsis sp. FR4]